MRKDKHDPDSIEVAKERARPFILAQFLDGKGQDMRK
jgi:hypothetical protein